MAINVCVCVFFPFILDIKFVGRTSRGHTGGRSHRISHPPSFCGACLNFFSREGFSPFLSLVDCGRILCDLIVLHPLGIFILFFSFLVRKIPFAGIELASQRVRGIRGTSELPGRPAVSVQYDHRYFQHASELPGRPAVSVQYDHRYFQHDTVDPMFKCPTSGERLNR